MTSNRRSTLRMKFNTTGMVAASSLAIGIASLATPALAQQAAPQAAAGDNANTIVVTGIRGSLSKSLKTKRDAAVIVDSITAQDIGALPDRTLTEALQRVPGITIQRTGDVNTLEGSDPGRVPAEGGGVFIRGLTWTRSELNGHDVFSANSGRGLSFEDVSPDLMGSVDVYKTPSADMVEGGIAGIVDLRTRKPLDTKSFTAISADWNYANQRKEGFFSGNGVLSRRWTLGGTEIGLLLSAATGKTGNRTDAVQTGSANTTTLASASNGLAAGSTVELPSGLAYRSVDWTQVRHSYDGVLQIKPSSNLLFTFEALVAKVTPRDNEHTVAINDKNGGFGLDPSFTFSGANNTLASGTLTNAQLGLDARSGQEDKITREFSGGMVWNPGDRWTVSVDVDHVSSHASVYSMTAFDSFDSNADTRPTVDFNLTGNNPVVKLTSNGADFNDPSQYFWTAAMDHIEDNYASSWAERADVAYKFDDGNFFKMIKFGVRHAAKDLLTQSSPYNWGLLSAAFWGGGTPVYLNQDPGNVGLNKQTSQYAFSGFLGQLNVPGGWFGSDALVNNGTANAYNYLKTSESAGWGWSPLSPTSYANSGNATIAYGTNLQTEKTTAGYVMTGFGQDSGMLGHFDGNVGVRVVRTENTGTGSIFVIPLANATTSAACIAAHGATACQALTDALGFIGNGSSVPLDARNSYTDVLPSLNTRFYLKKDLLLRFGVTKTISRPSFTDMQASQSYNFSFQNDGYTPSLTAPRVVNGGNPYLKPIKAWNFDASLEYYFGRNNAVTFAAFYKDISNYISAQPDTTTTVTLNGVTQTFQYNPPVNGGHGSIKGFEFGLTYFFDKLPGALSGFGFSGNYTFVDDQGGRNPANIQAGNGTAFAGDLPMQGLSRNSFNLELLYEKYGVSGRLAYNWRSTYMSNANGANVNQPVWNESYGQLDGSIIVNAGKYLKVGVQAQNLLKAPTYIDVGPANLHPRYAWEHSDRHIAFLIRSKF